MLSIISFHWSMLVITLSLDWEPSPAASAAPDLLSVLKLTRFTAFDGAVEPITTAFELDIETFY